jgi:2-oxoglutarate dehydrogenase E2 component (dihydrolipoamide succinyltransferase)
VRQPVRVPQIGFGQDSATILAWHRSVGEAIQRGEPIAEIEVEKTNMDVEVHFAGTVVELLCHPGEEVSVGQVIAYLETDATNATVADHDGHRSGGQR